MNRKTWFGITAALVLILTIVGVLTTVPVDAKGKGPKKIQWSQPKIEAQLAKGASIQTVVTFTPTVNIQNASFRVTASMSDTVAIDPPTFATLTAGTPYQITVTFTAPTEGNRKRYNGVAALVDDTKLYAKPLKFRYRIAK